MKKTRKETINELEKDVNNIENFYNSKSVNWSGTTSDTKEFYTEIIAKELLDSLDDFDKINKITRRSSYKIHNHNKIEIDLGTSNRHEDIFAKRIFGLEFYELGRILDYQIPIRDTSKDKGLKAFDILSYNKRDNSFYLIELKYLGNKNDTLLRAILECYTYFKIVDHNKLMADYNDEININESTKIKPVVLLVSSNENPCKSYNEFIEMNDNKRPFLKTLSSKLDIKIVTCELPLIFSTKE